MSSQRRDLTLWIAVFFLLLWALLTHSHPNSWNDNARLATVEALVHQGTWAIDDTVFGERTADRIFWRGHFYPDKPPVLSFFASGVYAVLNRVFHVTFDFDGWCHPVDSPCYCFALLCSQSNECKQSPDCAQSGDWVQSPDWGYYWLTLTLMGLPSALMLALFYRCTAFFDLPNTLALPLTAALGLGTMILPYSLVFNNHLPAAASLMVGFYALLRARSGDAARWLLVAGLATALAFTLDLLVVPFLAFFLGLVFLRHRRQTWAFLLGSAIPLALLAGLDWWILGDPLPPSMHPAGFDYPGSLFATTPTGNTPSKDVLNHGVQMLFGARGLFTLNPVMILSILGLWRLLRNRGHRFWGETAALVLACLAITGSLIVFTPGFGGVSYGTRWLAEITPLLLLFAAQPALYRSLTRRVIFGALAVLSVVSAWQGAVSPWGVTLSLPRLAQYAASPIGRYALSLPADAVIYTTSAHTPYLPVFPVHAWHTTMRQFDAAQGALPAGDPDRVTVYILGLDEQATGECLEKALPQGQWGQGTQDLSVYRVPPGVERTSPSQATQAEFADHIRLLGCDLSSDTVHPGDTLSIQVHWQALAPIENRYTAFVHLLGPQNPATDSPLWAQDDHQPGHGTYPTDRWFPGEVVLDRFQFTIPEDAPPGEYRLTTGFYDWVTLQRLARSDTDGDTAELARFEVSSQNQ